MASPQSQLRYPQPSSVRAIIIRQVQYHLGNHHQVSDWDPEQGIRSNQDEEMESSFQDKVGKGEA